MALPTIRDAVVGAPTGDPVSLDLPTHVAGDILVIIMQTVVRTVSATPTDWTQISYLANQYNNKTYVFAKTSAGTEGSSVSVDLSASDTVNYVSFSVSGAADITGNAIDADILATSATTYTAVCPGVTVSDNTSLVVRYANGAYYDTATTPGSHTLIATPSATRYTVWSFTQDAAQNAGALGTQNVTMSTDGGKVAGTLAFAPAAAAAPVISSVTLSGTSQIGNTLTATVVTDQDPADSTAYQWEKASDGSGTGAADLSGETSSTLALTYADFGDLLDTAAYVRCGAIATKNALQSDEAFSAWQQVTVPSSAGLASSPLKSPFLIA